jgi:hypothetical protein
MVRSFRPSTLAGPLQSPFTVIVAPSVALSIAACSDRKTPAGRSTLTSHGAETPSPQNTGTSVVEVVVVVVLVVEVDDDVEPIVVPVVDVDDVLVVTVPGGVTVRLKLPAEPPPEPPNPSTTMK